MYVQIREWSLVGKHSSFIFRSSSMQADIADRCDDCQLMYNKGKKLVFTSNTENVFFIELDRHCI